MPDNRVQAPELGAPEPLRPQGPPPDTFGGAPKPVADNRLASLADALGSFNTNLLHFGRAYQVAQRYHNDGSAKAEADAFEQFKTTHTQPEYLQAVKDGTIPAFSTPQAQASVAYTTGSYTANLLRNDYASKIGDGSINERDGSAQAWLQEQREKTLKDNGWDPKSGQARGFGEAFNTLQQQSNTRSVQAAVAQKQEEYNDAVFKQTEIFADNATTGHWDAAKSWQEMSKLKGDLQNAMHLQPKEADAALMKSLARRMTVDPNWVVELATTPRPDINGKGTLPALADTPEYADQVAHWKQQAVKYNTKQADNVIQARVADEDARSFANGDGSFNSIKNGTYKNPVSGEDIELKAAARRDSAMEAFDAASRKAAIVNKETPEQTFNREAETYINNGVVRESWKKELDAIPGITNSTNLTNPAAVKRAIMGAQTYDALEQRSPAYARSLVDDKTNTFFQTFRVLKQYKTNSDGSPISDQQALTAAGNAIRNDSPDTASYVREQITEANNKIADLSNPNGGVGKGLWYMLGYDTKPAGNTAYLDTEMRRLSTAFIRAGGVSAKDAIEMAAKELGKTGQIVNGQWLPKAGNMGLDLGGVSKRLIDNYVAAPAGKGHDAGDLMLSQQSGGTYVLTDRSGIPVPGGGRYTHEDLMQVQRGIGDEKQRDVIERQNSTANEATTMTAPLRTMWQRNADEWVERKHPGKSPDEIIRMIQKGGRDIPFAESPLGKAIIEQQKQRKATAK